MDATRVSRNERRIGCEILEMLMSYYILRDLLPRSDESIENLKTTHLTRVLTDDIILGLCKLADSDRRVFSFLQAARQRSKAVGNRANETSVQNRISGFRAHFKGLETLRNQRIAHLSAKHELSFAALSEGTLEALSGMYETLREAVLIFDDLTNSVNVYRVDGIELRVALFGPV